MEQLRVPRAQYKFGTVAPDRPADALFQANVRNIQPPVFRLGLIPPTRAHRPLILGSLPVIQSTLRTQSRTSAKALHKSLLSSSNNFCYQKVVRAKRISLCDTPPSSTLPSYFRAGTSMYAISKCSVGLTASGRLFVFTLGFEDIKIT